MLLVYLFGLGLWLIYGLRLHAAAVIVANAVGLVVVGAALLLKREMERPREIAPVEFVIPEVYACDNPLKLVPAYPLAEPEKVKALAYAANR
jgi:hypothetical protein